MITWYVVRAVFKRNFVSYFTSPTGYVFITLLIFIQTAIAFWREAFFLNNLANLNTLNEWLPYVYLFFIPTITMSVWAEERRHGTDELLLTLPARDVELVLGKYFSCLAIFSVALLFSFPMVLVLAWLGSPDFGVILGTYLGYWFLGASLLAFGMVGSLLTSSLTVSFILGCLLCAVPILLGHARAVLPLSIGRAVEGMSALEAFGNLTSGLFPVSAVVYFAALTIAMLYLNLVILGRRLSGPRSTEHVAHGSVRTVSLLAIAISVTVLGARYGPRLDMTQEGLHSRTQETRTLLLKIDPAKPVYITAYISPEVPANYVATRETLISLLREYEAIAGDRIQLTILEPQKFGAEARQAQESLGIKRQEVQALEEGKQTSHEIFLGVTMACGAQELVIPFIYRGMSIEYELTRSIGVVMGTRKKVGIATTDAKVLGGFDFNTFQQQPSWQIVDELKKQYNVTEVSLDQPVTESLDVLLVVMPSSLTQNQMNHLASYIKNGGATLLCDDPLPSFDQDLAPNLPKRGLGRGPFAQPAQEQKGKIPDLLRELGIEWPSQDIVWDGYNPYPRFHSLPKEFVFVGPGSGQKEAFNPKDLVTSGLQNMVFIYAGHIQPAPGTLEFTPLIRTTKQAGTTPLPQLRSRSPRASTGLEYTLAAHVTGKPSEGSAAPINVIFLADVDCIHEQMFDLRNAGVEELSFDNVTFISNCVDVLAREETYLSIRKRRPLHRTLATLEEEAKRHRDVQLAEEKKADEEVKHRLDEANKRLQDIKDQILKEDTDDQDKRDKLEASREAEQRRFNVSQVVIEEEKKAAIEQSRQTMNETIDLLQKRIKWLAVLATPLPALLIALCVLIYRIVQERSAA